MTLLGHSTVIPHALINEAPHQGPHWLRAGVANNARTNKPGHLVPDLVNTQVVAPEDRCTVVVKRHQNIRYNKEKQVRPSP